MAKPKSGAPKAAAPNMAILQALLGKGGKKKAYKAGDC